MPDSFVAPMTLKRRLRRLYRPVRALVHSIAGPGNSVNAKLAANPLMFADKTYNTAHPDYEPELARCYPGRIYNLDCANDNPLFQDIKRFARRGSVPDHAWRPVLGEAMAEARTVPGFDQVMERRDYVETYLADLGRRYGSHFIAGWVNMADAQFL
jgi:hypothetical protein